MANGVGKHKLLVIGPTEPWSVREKLCLASSVMKSGDQNWVSVSRAIKPFAEPGRPPDWFSQRQCASKYSELLEATEAPKRKRGDKGEVVETVEDVIVRRLTADRIEELKKVMKESQEKHRKLKREAELIQAGHLDSKLQDLWEEILQQNKVEQEEAEMRRKNTAAAYQDRQVAKSTCKPVPGVAMHCSSPNHDFSPGDPRESLTLDLAPSNTASGSSRLMVFPESPGPGPEDGSPVDDLAQKKVVCQKATPPPSPLLSELLKKGSILASNSRLIGEGDVSAGNLIGAHDLQFTQPLSQATAGAPMLSRLLEAGPTHFSAPLSFMVSADTVSCAPPPVHSAASAGTDDKVSGLSEEEESVSYMGDELDFKTVGDIIAIIEDKVQRSKADEAAEALDAAAVEAALSLCEENGHALSGAWEAGPFQPHSSHPTAPSFGAPQSSSLLCGLEGKVQDDTSASLSDQCLVEFSALPHGSSSSRSHSGATALLEAKRKCREVVNLENPHSSGTSIKYVGLEENPLTERHVKVKKSSVDMKLVIIIDFTSPSFQEVKPHNGSVARGESDSGTKVDDEVNEEEEGDVVEGFSSELEPAASESEDGCSLHTASSSLQLLTAADSIPSSPASSQFSACSEDQEALQAQKIWKKAIMLVWRAAANHRYANVFLQPVTDEIAPGYHSIVHRPMDLATIKKNIETTLIRTTAEFQRDIMLMFQNAVMYNSLDHDVHHMALEMQRDVLEQIQQFLATQLIMETSESGIGAKSLRGRESTRKLDSTDKDTVSMSSPAFLLSLFDGGTRGRRCAIEADMKMKK
uniref:bromodomain-containing protein 8-like isoform X4 n=1 Tax=Solea senegalensis TaxID=28829 RepID=UPI001CD9116C|nr:bromodomain-containing protein 8-like isoform X4 [Solea senegalensis]